MVSDCLPMDHAHAAVRERATTGGFFLMLVQGGKVVTWNSFLFHLVSEQEISETPLYTLHVTQDIPMLLSRWTAVTRIITQHAQLSSAHRYKSTSTSSTALDDGWQVIIGLEIHAQLRTKRKLFSRASGYVTPLSQLILRSGIVLWSRGEHECRAARCGYTWFITCELVSQVQEADYGGARLGSNPLERLDSFSAELQDSTC